MGTPMERKEETPKVKTPMARSHPVISHPVISQPPVEISQPLKLLLKKEKDLDPEEKTKKEETTKKAVTPRARSQKEETTKKAVTPRARSQKEERKVRSQPKVRNQKVEISQPLKLLLKNEKDLDPEERTKTERSQKV